MGESSLGNTFVISVQNVTPQVLRVLSFYLTGNSSWQTAPSIGQEVQNAVSWENVSGSLTSDLGGQIVLLSPIGGTVTINWNWPGTGTPTGTASPAGTSKLAVSSSWNGLGTPNVTFQVIISPPTSLGFKDPDEV